MFAFLRRDPPPLDLSVTVCAWNRAGELRGLIENVAPFAREVVVVDGGSDDETEAMCRADPRVTYVQQAWEGHFGRIKNASFAAASGEWILHLDTDERVSPGLAERLPWLCANRRREFYRLPMRWLVELDPPRYVRSKKHEPCYVPRLFRRSDRVRYLEDEGPVHPRFPKEVRQAMKKVRTPEACIYHYCLAWLSREELVQKASSYAEREPGSEATNAAYYLWWDQPHEIRQLATEDVPA